MPQSRHDHFDPVDPARPPDHFKSAFPSFRSTALACRFARVGCSSFPRIRRYLAVETFLGVIVLVAVFFMAAKPFN